MKDRSGRWVDVVPATRASPRLPALLGLVALEAALAVALGAVGVLAIGRVPGAPQMLETGVVVGELRQELSDRVVGSRRLRSAGLVSVGRWHGVNLLDTRLFVKSVYSSGVAAARPSPWRKVMDVFGVCLLFRSLNRSGAQGSFDQSEDPSKDHREKKAQMRGET